MSGIMLAVICAAPAPSIVQFVGAQAVNGGGDAAGVVYRVPSFAKIGDVVLFYSAANSSGNGGAPPGSGWTNTGVGGGGSGVWVKIITTAQELADTRIGGGGSLAFAVYRGPQAFRLVSGAGFNKSQYHLGVTFFGGQATGSVFRIAVTSNGSFGGNVYDFLPPNTYPDGTAAHGYLGVEFLAQ